MKGAFSALVVSLSMACLTASAQAQQQRVVFRNNAPGGKTSVTIMGEKGDETKALDVGGKWDLPLGTTRIFVHWQPPKGMGCSARADVTTLREVTLTPRERPNNFYDCHLELVAAPHVKRTLFRNETNGTVLVSARTVKLESKTLSAGGTWELPLATTTIDVKYTPPITTPKGGALGCNASHKVTGAGELILTAKEVSRLTYSCHLEVK